MQTTAFLGVAHAHTYLFAQLLKQRSDVRVKYIYDHNADYARSFETLLQSEAADIETILADEEVTSVVICSETRHHVDLVEQAVAAGKHLFVEKPLTFAREDAEQLATLIERVGVIFQTGFAQRGNPEVQFLRQQVIAGNLGTITRMRYTNCHHGVFAGWFDGEHRWVTDPVEAGGGAFADMGAHALDILLWVLTPVCGQVVNHQAVLGNATGKYGAIDEWGVGTITFESGAVGLLEASWVDPKLPSSLEIHGMKGQIVINDGKVRYYSELVEGADGGEWTQLPPALPHAFDLFWDKLEGRDVPLVTVQEAAHESCVMHELYRAANAKNA